MRNQNVNVEELKESFRFLEKSQDVILSLSTGSLALSITFRNDLISGDPVNIEYLKYSWIALALSIIAYVLNLSFKAGFYLYTAKGAKGNPIMHFILVGLGTFITHASFMLGVNFLVLFALKNIN